MLLCEYLLSVMLKCFASAASSIGPLRRCWRKEHEHIALWRDIMQKCLDSALTSSDATRKKPRWSLQLETYGTASSEPVQASEVDSIIAASLMKQL